MNRVNGWFGIAGRLLGVAALVVGAGIAYGAFAADAGAAKWQVHDESRPKPKVVTPGTESTPQQPGKAPSDAIVLFDGKDLSKWKSAKGGEPGWKVEDGELVIVGKSGDIVTREPFGDCQLHVEWSAPTPAQGESQGRGNSGVKIMGRYEVQVLDSYHADTYADGQAGALYGQYPPLVNASRAPGQWQTFDIIFHGPRFSADGKVMRPGTVTVLHNGVLVQDHSELKGTTAHKSPGVYQPHPEKLPLLLQDHGNPVHYRNIWIRPLTEERP
jgi:3-keto-disaccharide hydrolase